MRVFRTLGEALDMPGLRAVSSLLAARTAQMLTAATRYVEDEMEAGRHSGSDERHFCSMQRTCVRY